MRKQLQNQWCGSVLRTVSTDISEFSTTHAKLKPLGRTSRAAFFKPVRVHAGVSISCGCKVFKQFSYIQCLESGLYILRKADKDYRADFFEQQRRNDGYQDALEKLTARRYLDSRWYWRSTNWGNQITSDEVSPIVQSAFHNFHQFPMQAWRAQSNIWRVWTCLNQFKLRLIVLVKTAALEASASL